MTEIALLGNPNSGKTSLFNQLTGSYEYVGNWNGVTVEKKRGRLKTREEQIIDLPGVYSLNPLTRDEQVVTNFFLTEPFYSILNIVDASQLERNLQLTIQLLEMNKPLMIGLNMMDVAKSRGIHIDIDKLAELLDVNIQPIVARTGKGCHTLMDKIDQLTDRSVTFKLDYGAAIEAGIEKLSTFLEKEQISDIPVRWLAIQFFDENKTVWSHLEKHVHCDNLSALFKETEVLLEKETGKRISPAEQIFSVRDRFIQNVIDQSLTNKNVSQRPLSEKIDQIVTNKYLGIPIFLSLMYIMFMVTFNWIGTPLSDLLDGFITGAFSEWLHIGLETVGVSEFMMKLILDGIIPGVGGVLVFFPQIFILFFFISLLEDSGYMARISLVMDRLMESLGLNGKSFIPMIIGFGCNVPGIMSARTIEQPKDRLITILLTPFMSCSARLPVYALFVGAFFAKHQALIVLSLYVLGIICAFITAKILSKTILKNERSIFVIELPPYRVPHWQTLLRSTWDKGKGFIKKAGTFIFGGTVLIWILLNLGSGGWFVTMDQSLLALFSSILVPFFIPLGFGTWQAVSALMTGFLAKESVVAAMNIIYHSPSTNLLQDTLAHVFTPLSAYSFLVFTLLYLPCLPTVATVKKETDSFKWMIFSMIYPLAVAYVVSLLIYQGGRVIAFFIL